MFELMWRKIKRIKWFRRRVVLPERSIDEIADMLTDTLNAIEEEYGVDILFVRTTLRGGFSFGMFEPLRKRGGVELIRKDTGLS